MKTINEKPVRTTLRPKTRRRGGSPLDAKPAERVPADRQVVEFERTFSVRWEW